MTGALVDLGALHSLGVEQDLADATLLLEIVAQFDEWMLRDARLRGDASALFAYSFGAVWTDKRTGPRASTWRHSVSALPWSPAARALLEVQDGRVVVRRSATSRDPLTSEHVVPKNLIYSRMRELSRTGTPEEAVRYLHETTRVAIVTRHEGRGGLEPGTVRSALGLHRLDVMRSKKMPDDEFIATVTAAGLPWQWSRYVEVGHELSGFVLLGDAEDLAPGVREALARA